MTIDSRDSNRPVYSLFARLLALHAAGDEGMQVMAGRPYDLSCDTLFAEASSDILLSIANSAHTLKRALHLGTAAVGACMALAAPDVTDSDQYCPVTVEAIGWLLAELADLGAVCHHFEVTANRIVRERDGADRTHFMPRSSRKAKT